MSDTTNLDEMRLKLAGLQDEMNETGSSERLVVLTEMVIEALLHLNEANQERHDELMRALLSPKSARMIANLKRYAGEV